MSFELLYVCTGNVCRSPMAEILFRARASDARFTATSVGMRALVGEGIDRSSAWAMRQRGLDPSRHRARQFEPRMAAAADLVLTAERAHRDEVMTLVPSAFRRTFAMKEFARLARLVTMPPTADPVSVVAAMARARHIGGAVDECEDDIPDPFRGKLHEARLIAEQIDDTVHATIAVLDLDHTRQREVAATGPATRRRPLPHRR